MTRKNYRIYRTCEADFDRAAAELADRIATSGENAVRIVFFGDTTDNDNYIERRDTICRICAERFGEGGPLVGFIAQKPLRSSLAAEATVLAAPAKIARHEDYAVVDGREIISGNLQADIALDTGRQADAIFRRMTEILAADGFAATDIVRQWNYIEQITRMAPEGQHYQMFNDARSRFYDRCEWPNGYPAATGIGTRTGGVSVMFDAVRDAAASVAIDNPLQVAAHAYSQKVLIDKPQNRDKTTPKFERARYVADSGAAMVYISGTAAIRGEESCRSDIAEQTAMTMDNIATLAGRENLARHGVEAAAMDYAMLRVYIKRETDAEAAERWMARNYPDVPALYLAADICREELLVEIEGIACPNE